MHTKLAIWPVTLGSVLCATVAVALTNEPASPDAAEVYFDAASLYGPSFDGMALEFSNPRGLFRLRDNDPGWTMPNLTTYGIGFEAVEALP